jgi:hypothetical protein
VVVCRLLIRLGAEINAQDGSDITPLHLAAGRYGSLEVCIALIDNGALVLARDEAGMTPLHFASEVTQPISCVMHAGGSALHSDSTASGIASAILCVFFVSSFLLPHYPRACTNRGRQHHRLGQPHTPPRTQSPVWVESVLALCSSYTRLLFGVTDHTPFSIHLFLIWKGGLRSGLPLASSAGSGYCSELCQQHGAAASCRTRGEVHASSPSLRVYSVCI